MAVSDNGEPSLKSTSRVVIQVLDANDSPPSFPHKLFMVQLPEREASETPLPVYRLIASDRDQGQNSQITYTIEEEEEGIFTINPTTGMVFSRKAFPASEYNILTVRGEGKRESQCKEMGGEGKRRKAAETEKIKRSKEMERMQQWEESLNETDLGYRERNWEGMMGNAEGKKLLKMEDKLKLTVQSTLRDEHGDSRSYMDVTRT